MANTKLKYFILTGEPGVGKTTLIKKICSMVHSKDIRLSGFYTEEIKNNRVREGFDVVTFDGERGKLARDVKLLNDSAKCKVGKYGVLIEEFDKIAIPSLHPTDVTRCFIVIDEIGKMEFFSLKFKARVQELFSPKSSFIVLATIPIRNSNTIIESIRNNTMAKVWLVTRENRNILDIEISQAILDILMCKE